MITGDNQTNNNPEIANTNEFDTQIESEGSATMNANDSNTSQQSFQTNENNSQPNSESEKIKYSEFNYSNIPKKEDTAKVKIPMTWKRQTVVSVSTTIIASLPIVLKLYNNKKDPNMPNVTFSDVVDLIVYKFPDLYTLIIKLTKDGPFESIATKCKIGFILAPLIPTIKALFKHNEMVKKHGFDYMLLAHIFTFVVNTLIPYLVTNPTLNYAYNILMKGSIFNLIVGTLMRSNNPMAREVGKTIPALAILLDKFKFLSSAAKNEFIPNQYQNNNGMNYGNGDFNQNQMQQNQENVLGKNIIDFVTGLFGNNTYNYGGNYYNPRGFGGGVPYGYDYMNYTNNPNNNRGLWL